MAAHRDLPLLHTCPKWRRRRYPTPKSGDTFPNRGMPLLLARWRPQSPFFLSGPDQDLLLDSRCLCGAS